MSKNNRCCLLHLGAVHAAELVKIGVLAQQLPSLQIESFHCFELDVMSACLLRSASLQDNRADSLAERAPHHLT